MKSVTMRQHEVLNALKNKGGQFRRVVKPQPDGVLDDGTPWVKRVITRVDDSVSPPQIIETDKSIDGQQIIRRLFPPLGQLGDRVCVREKWYPDHGMRCGGDPLCNIHYGDLSINAYPDQERWFQKDYENHTVRTRQAWRSSTQMPSWSSRLTLEITAVRLERVQEMRDSGAIAEGFNGGHGSIPDYDFSATPMEHYRHTWNAHAKPGFEFEDNPFVWVYEYKVVEQAERTTDEDE